MLFSMYYVSVITLSVFTHKISFKPHNNHLREGLSSTPFYI